MNLRSRISNAFSSLMGRTSPDIAAFLTGSDLDASSNSGAKLVHPYAQSAWVYIAVSVLAQNIAQIPFRICRVPKSVGTTSTSSSSRSVGRASPRAAINHRAFLRRSMMENIIESGPVVDLFQQPHPSMDRALFWETIVTWQCLRGEFFVLPLDDSDQPVSLSRAVGRASPRADSPVRRMLTLDPGLFWHIVHGYSLEGWRYTGSPLLTPIPSAILLPDETIHSRLPNPYLFWRGMSPLSVASVTAQSDFAAENFMKGLMLNNADTGVIVTTDQQISVDQRDQIMAALRERKRKAGTADRPLLLWGGMHLEKPAISSADMQFLENRNMNRKEILAIFQVPEAIVGFSDRKESLGGGGGSEQERYAFVENTLGPHCRRLEDALRPIIKSFGADLDGFFDLDSLAIMQEFRRGRLDAATKAFAMGVPLNQINQLYDLGFQDIEGGDTGYLPFNLQPIEKVLEPDPTPAPGAPAPGSPSDPNAPDSGQVDDPNQNHLLKFGSFLSRLSSPLPLLPPVKSLPHVCSPNPEYEAALAPRVKQLRSKLKRFWFEQRSRILSKLPEVIKDFDLISANEKSWWQWKEAAATRGLDALFDHKSENEKLLKALKPILLSSLQAGGEQLWKEIGASKSDPRSAAVPGRSNDLNPSALSAVKSDFSVSPQAATDYLSRAQKLIADINQTTWDRLRASLQEGLSAGDSMSDLSARVSTFFNNQDARGDTIALTEINRATNAGRMEGMKDANVERKGWKTSHLENTRATHLENEQLSETENGIPLDDQWPNGCSYPGDPDADASETINCRCFGYAILTGGNS